MSNTQRNRQLNNEIDLGTNRVESLQVHTGSNTLPNSPLFQTLLRHAHRGWGAIRDMQSGVEKTYGDLLSDVLGLCCVLKRSLDVENQGDVFIGILARGGYEYTVAVLAVHAMGAAVVPLSISLQIPVACDTWLEIFSNYGSSNRPPCQRSLILCH